MTVNLGKIVENRSLELLPTKQEKLDRKHRKKEQDTAGPAWFNLPAPERTPELEKDLRVLAMRSVLDPKQHYRKGERLGQGKYFQVGTVVSDITGYYSDRLTKRQKGATILDTLMRDTERQHYFKKKYDALQQASVRAGRTPRPQKPWSRGQVRK